MGFNLGCAFLERKAQTVNTWKEKKSYQNIHASRRKCENDREQNLVTALRRAKRRVLVLAPLKHS
jgi:hypothetical protein